MLHILPFTRNRLRLCSAHPLPQRQYSGCTACLKGDVSTTVTSQRPSCRVAIHRARCHTVPVPPTHTCTHSPPATNRTTKCILTGHETLIFSDNMRSHSIPLDIGNEITRVRLRWANKHINKVWGGEVDHGTKQHHL